jgi:hypothetical protein
MLTRFLQRHAMLQKAARPTLASGHRSPSPWTVASCRASAAICTESSNPGANESCVQPMSSMAWTRGSIFAREQYRPPSRTIRSVTSKFPTPPGVGNEAYGNSVSLVDGGPGRPETIAQPTLLAAAARLQQPRAPAAGVELACHRDGASTSFRARCRGLRLGAMRRTSG